MSPDCSEPWTVLFGMTPNSVLRASEGLLVHRSRNQDVVFDDCQIASTPMSVVKGSNFRLLAENGQPAPYPSLAVRARNGRVADDTEVRRSRLIESKGLGHQGR
jgi:hypothetical protein